MPKEGKGKKSAANKIRYATEYWIKTIETSGWLLEDAVRETADRATLTMKALQSQLVAPIEPEANIEE